MPNQFQFNDSLWNGGESLFNSVSVNIVIKDVLGNLLTGTILATPILSSVLQTLIVPETSRIDTTGDVSFTITTGISILFQFQNSNGAIYTLATFTIPSEGNIGLLIRGDAGLATGVQTVKTITGNFFDLLSVPASNIVIKSTDTYINLQGDFIVPVPVRFPINSGSGAISVNLPPTTDLYNPSGLSPTIEINKDELNLARIGKNAFSVSSAAATFGVTSGSVVVN